MKRGHLLISLFLLLPLLSCGGVLPQQSGQYKYTQYSGDEDESGIGGTGLLAQESGLGGTGIIGEITGFGSIFVNGVEIEIEQETRLFMDGKKITQRTFTLGEVVALRSVKIKNQNVAREIHLRHEVIGTVQKIMPQLQQLIVLGQVIDTRLLKTRPSLGKTVLVSGFRDSEGIIHASKISTSKTITEVMLRGTLRTKNNAWFIGQQQLQLPANSTVQQGFHMRLHGVLINGIFQVRTLQRLNLLPFSSSVKSILIQGRVQKTGTAHYTISGYTFAVTSPVLHEQFAKQNNRIVHLQWQDRENSWKLDRILNKQHLPMGTLLPTTPHTRPVQPDRPMMFQLPYSMPNRFSR